MSEELGWAVVTGASSGIGLELARQMASRGYDLVVCAEDETIEPVAQELSATGVDVVPVRADLAEFSGVEQLVAAVQRITPAPDVLMINAGIGVGDRFVDRPLEAHLELIALNVTGAVHLAHRLLPAMIERGSGRVLITSSIAGVMPGPYESTYNASKAFLLSLSEGLREELKDAGVSVTALMPGPTDTNFFARAGIEDTKLGQAKKDDPADVARDGIEAMFAGDDHVVAGSFKNKVQATMANVLPDPVLAKAHAKLSEPGSGE